MWRSTAIVATVTIVSFLLLLCYALAILLPVQRELQQEISDSQIWVATQAEREAQQVLLALEGEKLGVDDANAALRFDILYSRVLLINDGPQLEYFRSIGEGDRAERAMELVQTMAPLDLSVGEDRFRFEQAATEVTELMRRLANRTNLAERIDRVERREHFAVAMDILLIALAGAFITGTVLALLLFRNMRRLIAARADLQRHKENLEHVVDQRTEELRKALTFERRAKDTYRSFVVTVTHQFRTPLAIIHMIAQRQMRKESLPPLVQHKFETVYDASVKLEGLLDDFLASAEADGGPITLKRTEVDFNELLKHVAEQVGSGFPDRELRLELAPRPLPVLIDSTLIAQSLRAILSNSLRYSSAPTPIILSTEIEQGSLICKVQDFGLGIPEIALPTVFEKYFRAENVSSFPGVGVGLTLARDIVVMHGGTIDLASRLGEGTICKLVLSLSEMRPDVPDSKFEDDSVRRG